MNGAMLDAATSRYRAGRTLVVALLLATVILAGGALVTHHKVSVAAWTTWGTGAVLLAGGYTMLASHPLCQIGTRQVVMMATGAALYALLSVATNGLVISSVSAITIRPAIVIPVLFGVLFGPAVGLFAGAVGNILGDAISGLGVFPNWDLGNGLVGMISGMVPLYKSNRQAANVATALAVLAAAAAALLVWSDRSHTVSPFTSHTIDYRAASWMMGLGAVMVLAIRVAFHRRTELLAATTWGVLGVVVGLGLAALSDIWVSGLTPIVATVGEFVPAAGPDILMIVILLPLLYSAYQAAVTRSGR